MVPAEMEKRTNDHKYRKPQESLAESYEPSDLPVGPAGGKYIPEPVGATSFERTSICAVGPCRHYWQLKRPVMEAVPGTLESLIDPETGEPVGMLHEYHHTCLVHPGTETEFTDDNVLGCNKWDPYDPGELIALRSRRNRIQKQMEQKDGNDDDNQDS